MPAPPAPLVIVSNRGPVAFVREPDGSIGEQRGVGGLVTALSSAVRTRDAIWIASAITDEDRERVATGEPIAVGFGEGRAVQVRLVALEREMYDGYYNGFSNRVIWFVHHALWEDGPPALGAEERVWWDAYREANARIAQAVARDAPRGAVAFVNDYHLALVPAMLRATRPDIATAYFWHIPFAEPERYALIPPSWGGALLDGMLAADHIGFHTARWADAFAACCRAAGRGDPSARAGVHPIGVDARGLAEAAAAPEVSKAEAELAALCAGRRIVLRNDRTEPSKNIVRGLRAYDRLLDARHDLHGAVVHLVMLTPSRRHVPEYQENLTKVLATADGINARHGRSGWAPVIVEIEDDYPRTLAAYRLYDVLLVNPVFDGMNLVAREGPVLNERDGVLVLSRNAGAAASLGAEALVVDPYDVEATADALARALDMPAGERRSRAERLRPLAAGRRPERWLEEQIEPIERR